MIPADILANAIVALERARLYIEAHIPRETTITKGMAAQEIAEVDRALASLRSVAGAPAEAIASRSKLALCPFCGSEAWVHADGAVLQGDIGYRVECEGRCHGMTCYWHTEQQAISAWNQRAAPADQSYETPWMDAQFGPAPVGRASAFTIATRSLFMQSDKRDQIIEECAKVVDNHADTFQRNIEKPGNEIDRSFEAMVRCCGYIALAIRALKSAAPLALLGEK